MSDPNKETIEAQRRRRAGPQQSGQRQRQRAEAPQRQRPSSPSSQGTQPPSGGGGQRPPMRPSQMGGGRPSGGRLQQIMGIVLFILVVIVYLVSGGEDLPLDSVPSSDPGGSVVSQPTQVIPTSRPVTPPAAASGDGQTWLVMFYQDADDKILEEDILLDLNEAERIGSTDRVTIVAQIDRHRGGYSGDGDWTSTRRYLVDFDSDLQRTNSQLIDDLGETSMADGQTLVDFVTWAVANYPADKYVLIMSDHGMGWPGGWTDSDPKGQADRSIPLSAALGDALYLHELDDVLGQIRSQTGIDKFEMIGMDACLMGHIEVFAALAPHARYAVASQETEPALGWAYTGFLQELVADPDMDGARLSGAIVETYINDDQRIVDDQARAAFLRQGSPFGGLLGGGMSADALARQLGRNITLTAVDLEAFGGLMGSVNQLAFALQNEDDQVISKARSYAQSFTSIFGKDVPPSYIDLGNFVQILRKETSSAEFARVYDAVLVEIDRTVIADKKGPDKPGATGISIYFPNSTLYRSPAAGPQSYTAVADRFAETSLWDDFLAYFYAGRTFELDSNTRAVPASGSPQRSPGAGDIAIAPITLSANDAAPGQPVVMTADVSGTNIGYIYLFVGFYDQTANSIFMADRDYLESPETREVDGIFYPVWSDNQTFTLKYTWEPVVFYISDGVNSHIAMLKPESYGATYEDTVYSVDGLYTYTTGEQRYARLYFRDGYLRQVFGFTSADGTGAPREITPQAGDAFTIYETWLDLDSQGRVQQQSTQPGGALVFGDQMFHWEELDAAMGDYIIGFIVEDLEGNKTQSFAQVIVK